MTPFKYTQMAEQKFNERVHWSYAEEPFTALRYLIQEILMAHGATEDELETPEACRLVGALASTSAMDADGGRMDTFGEAIWIAAHRINAAFRDGADTETILNSIIADRDRRASLE